MAKLYFVFCVILSFFATDLFTSNNAEVIINPVANETQLVWCSTTRAEQMKCEMFAKAVVRDKVQFKKVYHNITCLQRFDTEECMTYLDNGKVHVTTLDSGEVFTAGRFHSLLPILQEVHEGGFKYYYATAVVKKNSNPDMTSLSGLRGKKACFAGVGTLAGWVIPIHTLMKRGNMEIIDCNNHVKSAINFFGPSCAVNSLIDKYNPIGDNSDKLCQLCTGKVPGGKCTRADPYAGYEGAFRCLLEAGDVAFVKHSTVSDMLSGGGDEFSSVTKEQFELFCTDGSRRPLEDYRSCHWGQVPSNAIVTTSAKSFEEREKIQEFFEIATQLYGVKDPNAFLYNTSNNNDYNNPNNRYNNDRAYSNDRNNYGSNANQDQDRYNSPYGSNYNNNENYNGGSFNTNRSFTNGYDNFTGSTDRPQFFEHFNLFESVPKYGDEHNLMFQDNTKSFYALSETEQVYTNYLKDTLQLILGIRDCPVNQMRLCVTSNPEMQKCIKMKTALEAQLLKPEMQCFKGQSHIHCMYAIQAGTADVAMLDASDIYTAGLHHDLVPIISEVYNLQEAEYYVVAVAREEDDNTDLTYLRGKNTCHTGINMAAGWVYPLAYLISNGWIRSYGCNSIRAAAEYFSKSCVPGALSTEYNTDVPYDNMCDLCHGASYRYCRRDAAEDYFGYTGALRCLVEGGGDVAFVKHTTVMENSDGKRREWWARNTLTGDLELLCPDGTRAEVNEYQKCNLGIVKANALVTRGGYAYNLTEINAYINLFIYAQQFYGRKDADEFSFAMFYSPPPYSDLIFQDAAQQLRVVPPEKRYYSDYVGKDYMRARRIVDCHAGASNLQSIISTIFASLLVVFIRNDYF